MQEQPSVGGRRGRRGEGAPATNCLHCQLVGVPFFFFFSSLVVVVAGEFILLRGRSPALPGHIWRNALRWSQKKKPIGRIHQEEKLSDEIRRRRITHDLLLHLVVNQTDTDQNSLNSLLLNVTYKPCGGL